MNRRNLSLTKHMQKYSRVVACSLVFSVSVFGQSIPSQTGKTSDVRGIASDDYLIGPGDVLAIAVTDAPEFTGKFRVDQSGYLAMSSLLEPMKAEGKTPIQLSKDLVKALEDARLYREPTVNVFVDEYHGRTVSVVGAVAKPGIYPLQRRTTVIEMISEASLLPTAGNKVTIIPIGAGDRQNPGSKSTPQTFDLAKIMRGEDPSSNVELHDGDVVSVAVAEIVYVVGAVTKPGGFVMQDRSAGISALQAIALAEGTTSVASRRGLIIRRNADGTAREHIQVDLSKMMTGKVEDLQLAANDILFVPVSGSKQTLKVMGQVGMTAINGVAFYGLGYRVGAL